MFCRRLQNGGVLNMALCREDAHGRSYFVTGRNVFWKFTPVDDRRYLTCLSVFNIAAVL